MPTFHRNKDVEGNAPHPLAPFPVSELSWDGLGMVKKNKRILENISGSIGSGQLLACTSCPARVLLLDTVLIVRPPQ